jgi:hypothetical protein
LAARLWLEPAAMRAWALTLRCPRSKTKRPPFQAARESILGVRRGLSMLRGSGFLATVQPYQHGAVENTIATLR